MRQRETQHEQGRGRERGRHRIGNRLQALSSQHRARRGARTRNPEIKSVIFQLSQPGAPKIFLFFFNFFFNVYLFWGQRETEHERGRGRERGRQRIGSRLQALSHHPRARRGARTHRPRDHDLSRSRTLNRLSHPGAPLIVLYI